MTVKDQLLKLPADIAEKALINARSTAIFIESDSICDALLCAFYWDQTPQGHDYWEAIFNAYEADETSGDKMFHPSLN